MKPRINISKVWFDNDVIKLKIEVNDGNSIFCNKIYVGYDYFAGLIKELSLFRDQLYENSYDIKIGAFGSEYCGGFLARLHFKGPGTLFISTQQQSEFQQFPTIGEVASEAKMYLTTEPILLDNFIAELKILDSGVSEEATLVCDILR